MSVHGRAALVATMALVAAPLVGIPAADATEQRTDAGIAAVMAIKQHLTPVEQKQSMQFVIEKHLRADAGLRTTLPASRPARSRTRSTWTSRSPR
jgi:hypothetical protein